MNWEYLHLVTHSFPIVLSMTGAGVGLVGWGTGRPELERWGVLALLVGGAFVVPAYFTGLAAADVAAERTFVRPSVVQDHRFAATWAMVPLLLAGALAGFSLYDREDARLRRFVLLVGLVAAGAAGYAAYLGSGIEHRAPASDAGADAPGQDPAGRHAGRAPA